MVDLALSFSSVTVGKGRNKEPLPGYCYNGLGTVSFRLFLCVYPTRPPHLGRTTLGFSVVGLGDCLVGSFFQKIDGHVQGNLLRRILNDFKCQFFGKRRREYNLRAGIAGGKLKNHNEASMEALVSPPRCRSLGYAVHARPAGRNCFFRSIQRILRGFFFRFFQSKVAFLGVHSLLFAFCIKSETFLLTVTLCWLRFTSSCRYVMPTDLNHLISF